MVEDASRNSRLPVVRVIGAPGGLLDLADPAVRVRPVKCVDARERGVNVVHALLS